MKNFAMISGGVALTTLLLVSYSYASPHHSLIRLRREPDSTSPMPSHAGHSVKCDGDNESLKKSCPDNNTCPMDDETLEKCCHCLSMCCSSGGQASSYEEDSNEKKGNETSPEPEPGTKEKTFKDKVKDAASSAEGWLKNTGQNIKSSFDKAAESVKQTASDLKDKAIQGINNLKNKVKNATDGDNGEMTTEMNKTEESTPVPGYKKSKRDVGDLPSFEVSYMKEDEKSSGDTQDTTTVSGRRQRRALKLEMTTEQDGMATRSSRRRRDVMSTTEKGSGIRSRSAVEDNMSTTTENMSRRTRREVKDMSTTQMSTGRQRRGSPDMTTESNSNATRNGRNRREAMDKDGQSTTTEGKVRTRRESGGDPITTTMSNSSRNRREAGTDDSSSTTPFSNGRRTREASKDEATMTSTTEGTSRGGSRNKRSTDDDNNTESSVTTSRPPRPPATGRRRRGVKNGRGDDGMSTTEASEGTTNLKGTSTDLGSMTSTTLQPSSPPSVRIFIRVVTGKIGRTPTGQDKPSNVLNLAPGLKLSRVSGIYNSDIALFKANESSHGNNGDGQAGGGVLATNAGGGIGNSADNGDWLKPGQCEPRSTGSVCISPDAGQCSHDADCPGAEKCCFYACHPYSQVGVCDGAV